MARSQNYYSKREKEKKRLQKKKEKQQRKEERKATETSGKLEEMMAYVDEYGNISSKPIETKEKSQEIDASDIEIGIPKKQKEDLSLERRGKVQNYNPEKGYGFITQDGTNEQYFVHRNSVDGAINDGDRVSFSLEKSPKGLSAIRVKILK